jgi:hypothetical protein
MTTVIHEDREVEIAGARVTRDGLWLTAADVVRAAGWTSKPEGLCRDDRCVPAPRGREAEFLDGGAVNLAAFWQHMGRPVVRDDAGEAWVLGTGARSRAPVLESLEAPDFALPDLEGRMHALRDQPGRKVLLVTWPRGEAAGTICPCYRLMPCSTATRTMPNSWRLSSNSPGV